MSRPLDGAGERDLTPERIWTLAEEECLKRYAPRRAPDPRDRECPDARPACRGEVEEAPGEAGFAAGAAWPAAWGRPPGSRPGIDSWGEVQGWAPAYRESRWDERKPGYGRPVVQDGWRPVRWAIEYFAAATYRAAVHPAAAPVERGAGAPRPEAGRGPIPAQRVA